MQGSTETTINSVVLLNLQIRERFKRRLNVIFPAVSDANSTRKTSKVNPSDVDTVRIIEVQPCSGVFELKEQ
jgi:hypothetical protein